MFFRKRQVQKLKRQLGEHLSWVEQLRHSRLSHLTDALRREEFSVLDRQHVLALNFELASHASRALALLRQLEELGEATGLFDSPDDVGQQLRHRLRMLEDLPAVPKREADALDEGRTRKLWESFIQDRETFYSEERMVLAQLDLMKVAETGIFFDVPEGMTRQEALEHQKGMADIYREIDWDAIIRKKMADEDH